METAKPEAVRPLPIRNRALVAWSSAAQLLPRRDVLVHLGGPVLPVGDRLAAHHLAAVTTVAVLALALFRLHVAIMIAEAPEQKIARSGPVHHLDRSPRFRRRSPHGGRRFGGGRYGDGRENPDPCSCLGVFGMSINTNEKDLRDIFGSYGEIESVQIVYDRNTGRSRGFGFVYFASTREAARAKEALRDTNIDGARVRIDFSVTKCGGPDRRRRSRSRSPRRTRRSRSRS
ncbi:hypothetical protein QR680_019255 [Steinernema hermaphroditum]|uniref:RRM domain-containing protein n=1 Tax=Steinernema hermaphroditum TaxID=289476 RepID=A0AA39HMP1_9BILA|nr:hypothetical protein QR680_019255 [Steinernema hermaphroditum]